MLLYTAKINQENCVLDHVVPQSKGGDNSYRNIVAASFDANSSKGDKNAEDFARELYRSGLLNLSEMNHLLERIEDLQEGKLIPRI
jgi:CRISPR/Cas system Type II protein with McrA/HNH and RuvC-like nuclease domain